MYYTNNEVCNSLKLLPQGKDVQQDRKIVPDLSLQRRGLRTWIKIVFSPPSPFFLQGLRFPTWSYTVCIAWSLPGRGGSGSWYLLYQNT